MSVHFGCVRVCVKWAALATIVALAACGGGGGGGSSENAGAPAGPDGNAPLVLGAGNMAAVALDAMRATESVLQLAQFAAGEVSALARQGTLQYEVACFNSGGASGAKRYTLQDADGNRRISAGDTLTISYVQCEVEYLNGRFDGGTLTIRLSSVDDAERGAISGTLDFGAGVSTTTDTDGSRLTWLGGVQFRRDSALLSEQITVSATAADDLRQSLRVPSNAGPQTRAVAYQRPSMARLLDRQTARIRATGSFRLASERLGGRVDVSFEPEFSAYLSTNADSGGVRIVGAGNARLTVPASPGAISETSQVELDANVDGVAEASVTLAWRALLSGFLWSESSGPGDGSVGPVFPGYLNLLSLPTHNGIMGLGVDVARPLLLQFNRPLSADSAAYFKLFDTGLVYAQSFGVADETGSGFKEIGVRVRILGAAIVLEPLEPLRYGHGYQVLMSGVDDFDHPSLALLRDTSGTAAYQQPYVQLTSFETDGALWAAVAGAGSRSIVMPGHAATVSATTPFATSLPLHYRWTQVSGPTLVLGSADAAATSLSLASGAAPGLARATLELTVTDAVGRSSADRVQVQVANLQGATTLLYFASDPGEFIGGGRTRVYLPAAGSFSTDTTLGFLTVRYDEPGLFSLWKLELAAPGGGVPVAGSYANAVGMPAPSADVAALSFAGDGRHCGLLRPSSFQVLEIERDAGGNVQRLAVDFQQACVGNTTGTLRGVLRINSNVPFQP